MYIPCNEIAFPLIPNIVFVFNIVTFSDLWLTESHNVKEFGINGKVVSFQGMYMWNMKALPVMGPKL